VGVMAPSMLIVLLLILEIVIRLGDHQHLLKGLCPE
jgi:hypothetical protein